LEVASTKVGRHIVQFNQKGKCQWALLVVYGPAHEELKDDFLVGLSAWYNGVNMPYIVGSDVNIIRHCGEKNKFTSLPRSSKHF
jgi:hypothetical protein